MGLRLHLPAFELDSLAFKHVEQLETLIISSIESPIDPLLHEMPESLMQKIPVVFHYPDHELCLILL